MGQFISVATTQYARIRGHSRLISVSSTSNLSFSNSQILTFYLLSIPHYNTIIDTMSFSSQFVALNPSTKVLLIALAFLDPSCIEEVIFEQWVWLPPTQLFFRAPSEYPSARAELLQAFLIQYNEEGNKINIHPRVQDEVKAQLTAEDAAQIFWNNVCNFVAQWPSGREAPSKTMQSTPPNTHSVREWPKRKMLYHHVVQLKKTWEDMFKDVPTAHDVQWAGLLADVAWSVVLNHRNLISTLIS